LIRILYSVLVVLLAPVAFAAVLVRGLREPQYWRHPGERFGLGRRLPAPSIWLHAVSLGEVSAAAALVRELRARYPGVPFVLTTATPTGRARAMELFGGDVDVRFLPYDTPGSVRRFLIRTRPRVAIIMETELWPTLLGACARRSIPVAIASARLTARSVSGYRRGGRLFRDAVASIALIAAQTREDAQRFLALGASPARTRILGNIKFDMQLGASVAESGRSLRAGYLGSRPVWVAGSTHAGEEEALVVAHAELRRSMPEALLVLVPRHPQRFEGVAGMLSRHGVRFERRTRAKSVSPDTAVLLVDAMGELTAFYAAADVAFVGGSLVPVGGHNLLEPAALGVPVITGPHTMNNREIARRLIDCGGAVEVADSTALPDALCRLFADPAGRQRMGACAREFVEAHRGSLTRLVDLLEPLLRPEEPV
jgi:3-deoxy-D-manno-octulosonic-acid transferase